MESIKEDIMDKVKFNRLLKIEEPKKIIRMHCNGEISLNSYQLDKVIKLKNKSISYTKSNQILRMINKIIVLPDNYYLCMSNNDYHLISLIKKEKNNEKMIEQFILDSFNKNEIVEFGLELGEYLNDV